MVARSFLLALTLTGLAQSKNVTRSYGNSSVLWTTCGELANKTLECATLHVPLDHWAVQTPSNKTFSVPLMRMLTNDSQAETILLNPGGPGGSGIDFLKGWGPSLDKILGGNFHLLGFDPRGVARSKPQAKCMPDDAILASPDKIPDGPLVPSQDYTLTMKANSGDFFVSLSNYAALCNETMGEYMSFMNTPQTAADMVDILNAIGAKRLNFYGASYGTVLGATFAQMFPDKIGRVALDGVADYKSYWTRPTAADYSSTDDCLDELLQHCISERATCPLADGYKNASELRVALEHKIDSLDIDPATVYINASAYGSLRGEDIRASAILTRLYSPAKWPLLVRSLTYLMRGQYVIPYLHFFGGVVPLKPNGKSNVRPYSAIGDDDDSPDAFWLITRADKSPADQDIRVRLTRKQLVDSFVPEKTYIAKDMGVEDPILQETWLLPRSHKLEPAEHIKTALPVLLLSSKFDPVTPLKGAQALHHILQDSSLLVQNSIGHTTLSKPSKCTIRHIKEYFVNGMIPAAGTACEPDDPLYFPLPKTSGSKVTTDSETFELEQAMNKLSEWSGELATRHARRR